MNLVNKIVELLELHMANAGKVDRADVDELLVYMDAASELLPRRATDLMGSLSNYDSAYPHWHFDLCQRLRRIIEVSQEIEPHGSTQLIESTEPTFSLNSEDKKRVLDLCAQIRKIIFATGDFDQAHKRLLLNRVAAIEYQVEQPKGKLDVLRAGVSEVGETLGKFGTDIEPLTKRIKEVFQIGRRNSDEYAQIPAPEDIKQLPAPDDNEEG